MRIRVGGRDGWPGRPPDSGAEGLPGGRGEMTELERLLHLFVSLQILFGSRRGLVAPLVLLVVLAGGWMVWNWVQSPLRVLEAADRRWDTGDSAQRIEAIREYKSILRTKDPVDRERNLLKNRNDRARLYRRIVEYHVRFDLDRNEAREWILRAWQENLRDLDFGDQVVDGFYRETVAQIRSRGIQNPFDTNLH